jgi:hypothetical protein
VADIVRLHVNLNQETATALTRIADDHGLSLTEVVRRAISVYAFVHDERAAGHIITTGTGKKRRELVLL